MTERSRLGFDRFWKMRGTQGFWITHYVSYPSGAVLAWLFARLGIGPSTVTVAGGLMAWIGAAWIGFAVEDPWLGGLTLLLILMFSYSLDCADGVLARATGTTSPFGAVLDKVMDAGTMILVPGLLCISAQARAPLLLPPEVYPFVALAIIAVRLLLAVAIWLKDFSVKDADHLGQDKRHRSWQWHVRRLVGQTTDTPVFYILLAGTWWAGGLWEALGLYALWNCLILVSYLILSFKDMRAAASA